METNDWHGKRVDNRTGTIANRSDEFPCLLAEHPLLAVEVKLSVVANERQIDVGMDNP